MPSSTAPTPDVSVIVPARNAAATLHHCLASIRLAATGLNVEIIVADNGSTDASASVARSFDARVISLPDVRVSEVRSKAAEHAAGPILAFIDADHEIVPRWFHAAIATLATDRAGAVGTPYRSPSPATWVQQFYDALRPRHQGVRETSWLASGNLAVRKRVFDEVGGFDPSLETCEDIDLCRRIRGHGYRVLSDSRLTSIHHGDPATLRDLFKGELWRGRDTLRLGLMAPVRMRDLPGTLLPVVTLTALVGVCVALLAVPRLGWWPVALLGTILAALPVPRALIMARRSRQWPPAGWIRAYVVAAVYETARALAPVARAGPEVRQSR
jgi:hypothetical protein